MKRQKSYLNDLIVISLTQVIIVTLHHNTATLFSPDGLCRDYVIPFNLMVNYDSDSSGGDESFTETSVIIGYASQKPNDDTISHLGGYPVRQAGKRRLA